MKAGLAQLVEQLICNQWVGGSNPSSGTKYNIMDLSYFNKSAGLLKLVIFLFSNLTI